MQACACKRYAGMRQGDYDEESEVDTYLISDT